MHHLKSGLSRSEEEAARDELTQAQAALSDGQPGAALRALSRLHALVVPALDGMLCAQLPANAAEAALSCGAGFLGLYQELPDLDIERSEVGGLLLSYAARAELPPEPADPEPPLGPALNEAERSAQWAWIEAQLSSEPPPRPHFWRRLVRSAAGGLGDRARIQVQRGALVVLERLPGPPTAPDRGLGDGSALCETDLGRLLSGDRLTLQLQVPLPGRVAVFHSAGDDARAELEVLLPASVHEEAPRRALEVVEVSGEVAWLPEAKEQGLILLWAPEPIPAAWYRQVALRGRLPRDVRLWRYRYRCGP